MQGGMEEGRVGERMRRRERGRERERGEGKSLPFALMN